MRQLMTRLWHTLMLYTILSSGKRAIYIKRHKLFHNIGQGCKINERKIPLYSNLISLGNNVHLASKVCFVTHDAIHLCLNHIETIKERKFRERIGCIEIGDNVFIGSNTTILYDVRIGSNVIVGAGSLVNKDIPDNSVAVGVPAKVVGSFDDFVAKREKTKPYPDRFRISDHILTKELEEWCWSDFHSRHQRQIMNNQNNEAI